MLAGHRQRVYLGNLAWTWHNWTQVEILVREAERLMPSAPASSVPVSLVREQAARRERKARADRLATQAAMVWIRQDLGQNDEAVTELKEVIAERKKIAAEEPANADYQADLAESYGRLGRLLVAPQVVELIPTAAQRPGVWRYTTQKPPEDWTRPDFDDSRWRQGTGGFGTPGTPGAVIGTTWNSPDIWIRRRSTFPPQPIRSASGSRFSTTKTSRSP